MSLAPIADQSAKNIDERNIEHFQEFLESYFEGIRIESLPVEYATSHFTRNGQGVKLNIEKSGNLSRAIIASISNPYIFNLPNNNKIDPGIDRTAATPISDACLTFHPEIIIAINVTGNKSIYDKNLNCKVIEIELETFIKNETDVILGRGPEYNSLIKDAFNKTLFRMKQKAENL